MKRALGFMNKRSFYPNIISYWQQEGNANDSVGTNNGVATGIAYGSGLVGQSAIFDGSDFISIPDADNLSFTNGTTDIPFSISVIANFNSTATQWLINKRGATSGTDEYQLIYYSGKIAIFLFNYNNNSSYLLKEYTFTPTFGQNYIITVTYIGNGLHTGLGLYVDAVSVGTSSVTGTYIRMNNGTSPLIIGQQGWAGSGYFNGTMDEIVFFDKALTSTEVTNVNAIFQSGNHL